jgi:hypothetical protein
MKICCNHLIGATMKLTAMAGKDTAWIWHAMDTSPEEGHEDEIILEQFAIRFKTAEQAKDFEKIFLEGVGANTSKSAPVAKSEPVAEPVKEAANPGGFNFVAKKEPSPTKIPQPSGGKPSGKFDFNFDGSSSAKSKIVLELKYLDSRFCFFSIKFKNFENTSIFLSVENEKSFD